MSRSCGIKELIDIAVLVDIMLSKRSAVGLT